MMEPPPPVGAARSDLDKGGLFDNAEVGAGICKESACSEIVAFIGASGSGTLP